MIYHSWIVIVIYPLDPSRVLTREERLDTSHAVRIVGENFKPSLHPQDAVVTQDMVVRDAGEFVAMEIDDYGFVTVWAENKVYYLLRDRGLEKFIGLRRNPPTEDHNNKA